MEIRTPVKTIQVKYKCPKCKTGYLIQRGVVWDSIPASYEHHCTTGECDFTTMLDKRYPYIDYEEDRNHELHPLQKRYISSEIDSVKILIHGYPINPDEPRGDWQCFGAFKIIVDEQQDKVELQKIFFEEEVEIRKVEDKEFAFIKAIG